MPAFTQADRNIAITSPLGKDGLLLAAFTGTERVSGLFHFDLEMWSEKDSIEPTDIVGKNVTIEIVLSNDKLRHINGIVSRFSAGVVRDELRFYRAEVVPWLWYLTQTMDCKIYQNKNQTVKDIIETVFKEYGLTDFNISGIKGTHPPLEYCVQYRESAFDFVSRLMESEGIYYYFEHEAKKHTLVLADNSAFKDCSKATVEFNPHGSRARVHVNRVTEWEHRYQYHTGKWSLTDYNYVDNPAGAADTPSKHLMADTAAKVKLEKIAKFGRYEYPGGFLKKTDGKGYTDVRMQAEETSYHQVFGASQCAEFAPGKKFKIINHNVKSEDNKAYVLTSVTHQARVSAPYRLTDSDDEVREDYRNDFTCVPAEVKYRPARVTPKPAIYGSQTAVVVGKKGEEIWTDEHGRVKVQFFWDRDGKRDEKSLCWVRCTQSIAGKGWGGIFIPRIGQEVVISFLDGDPDRPIITGVVYNGEQTTPYKLPDNQTKSGFKSMSTLKGTAETFNELRFDDKKDSEEIYFHAETDFNRVVENNDTLKVGFEKKDLGDQKVEIHNNQTLIVGNDKSKEGNQDVKIHNNQKLIVGNKKSKEGNQTSDIHNNQVLTVGNKDSKDGSQTITIWKNRTATLKKGDEKLTVDEGNRFVTVTKGNDTHQLKKGNREVKIDAGNDTLTIKSGNQKVKLNAGQTTTDAMKAIVLKVGGNSIKIDQKGIVIKGLMVSIQGTAKAELKAPMTDVKGDGMLKLKGGMVMIN